MVVRMWHGRVPTERSSSPRWSTTKSSAGPDAGLAHPFGGVATTFSDVSSK